MRRVESSIVIVRHEAAGGVDSCAQRNAFSGPEIVGAPPRGELFVIQRDFAEAAIRRGARLLQ